MPRRRTIAWTAFAYLVICLALGWATTVFFNHYVSYAWRHVSGPERAQRWGIEVADVTTTIRARPEGIVRVREAWLETTHRRRFTLPLVPYPDVFFMNRYSLKLHGNAFRALHLTLDAEGPAPNGLELVDVPEGPRLVCGGSAEVAGRFHCAVWLPDPSRTAINGRLPGPTGADGVAFVVSTGPPP